MNETFLVKTLMVTAPFLTAFIIYLLICKPWYKFICFADHEDAYSLDEIRYNIFNKTYYHCDNDHYGCLYRRKLTNLELAKYELKANNQLNNVENNKKIKMKNSNPSFLVKILKTLLLIFIIILSYKIGLILIEKLPELISNQFK